MLHIPCSIGCELRLDVFTQDFVDHLHQLDQGIALSTGNVDHLARRLFCGAGLDVCPDVVFHVGKIAALGAVSVDHRLFVILDQPDEFRYHGAVLRGGILIGAKNVKVALGNRLQAIELVKHLAIKLLRIFGECIGDMGFTHIFHFGQGFAVPIDGRGRCKTTRLTPNSFAASNVKHAKHVHIIGCDGIIDGTRTDGKAP